ncbi:CHRD domain-containing protein [Streptomyces sp. HMX112]|uniref:CHRD domain-containing protein n=1 Tax=Streptomyces sp. HMX112 TaxID=3390850 RepID=UPI003A7FBB28
MRRRTWGLWAAGVVLGLLGTAPAAADGSHGTGHARTASGKARGGKVSLAAIATGGQEVPDPHGPAVGDDDGKAAVVVNVRGKRITFALRWRGILAPTQAHIHRGRAGENGDVVVPLFSTPMPEGVHAAAGHISLEDAELARHISRDPGGFYVNLHNEKFPGGAVRGQLERLRKPANPLAVVKGGKILALASGLQEVPNGDDKPEGDIDGVGIAFLHPRGRDVGYSLVWTNITAPVAAHVHEGGFGKNGDVRVPLLTTPVPDTVFAVSGTVRHQDARLLKRLAARPGHFYANLHTEEFPDGAVRGQLFG